MTLRLIVIVHDRLFPSLLHSQRGTFVLPPVCSKMKTEGVV